MRLPAYRFISDDNCCYHYPVNKNYRDNEDDSFSDDASVVHVPKRRSNEEATQEEEEAEDSDSETSAPAANETGESENPAPAAETVSFKVI